MGRAGIVSARRDSIGSTLSVTGRVVLLAGVITALGWPITNGAARPGLDLSWQAALPIATALSLRQGVDILFTYGPLGFLTVPHPVFGGATVLALLATGAVYLGLVVTVLIEARRLLPLWASALVTLLVARMFFALLAPEAFQVLLFAWAVEAIAGRLPLGSRAIVVFGGVLAGVASMVKLDIGVVAFVMGAAAATSVSVRWLRGLTGYVIAFVATVLMIWLVTGQRLTDLGAFAVGSYNIVAGFSESMGVEYNAEAPWAGPAVVVTIGLLSWLGWGTSRNWQLRRRIAYALAWAIFAFASWKITAVREHFYTFPGLAVALFALTSSVDRELFTMADRRAWVTSFALLWIASAAATPFALGKYIDVRASIRSVAREVKDVLPAGLQTAAERTRTQLRDAYQLPSNLLTEVAGRTVHLDPWETAMAYAYPEFRWDPLPVFQTYSAYTPYLDELNAARLRSTDAPDRILRNVDLWANPPDWLLRGRRKPLAPGEPVFRTVDGRFRWFESPAATLETFCRYTEIDVSGGWQVLARTRRSCGDAEPLGIVVAREGETVAVPAESRTDRFVVVRIHGLEPTPLVQIVATLYKANEWYITLGDGVRYRLVAATAPDGLLLAVPPAADGTGPFAFGPPIATIAIDSGTGGRGSSRSITYEFESVPLQH